MSFFYYAFNGVGMVAVVIVSLLALLGLLIHTILSEGNKALRMAIGIGVFLLVQFVAFRVLLSDFPEPSVVDLTPIEHISATAIPDFEARQTALENTRYFRRKNEVVYNYYFQYWVKPSVELRIYRLEDEEEALRNLLVSAGEGAAEVRETAGKNYVYLSESRLWRGRDTFFSADLAREVTLCFTVGNYLFVLYEQGSGAPAGSTINEVVALLLETFFDADG